MVKAPAVATGPDELPPTAGCCGCRDPHRCHHSRKRQKVRRKFGLVTQGVTADGPQEKQTKVSKAAATTEALESSLSSLPIGANSGPESMDSSENVENEMDTEESAAREDGQADVAMQEDTENEASKAEKREAVTEGPKDKDSKRMRPFLL